MQLKMEKPFNASLAKQLFQQENKFISDIFSITPLPMSETVDQSQQLAEDVEVVSKARIFPVRAGKARRAQTFEELHAKLEELKNVKKLEYKQKQLKRNLKNKIKKKSKREERSSQKKLIRAERLLQKNAVKTESESSGLNQVKSENGEAPKIPRPKPVFNSEGKMVFSKFDFSEIGTKKKLPKASKDPKKMLQQITEKKQKLKELEQSGEKEKADEIKEKEAWKAALAKASGEKVKDDPDLLKKTIKKQEQKKKHSAKKWESRLEAVQKSIRERQEKRQENIMKRKKDKKTNKLKKSAKKGRVMPGF